MQPEFHAETKNQTCLTLMGETADGEIKVDPNADGTFAGPGGRQVTISNTQNDKTFDFSANFLVIGVYVKAGDGGSNLYDYTSLGGVMSDDGLTSPGASGNQISHISFCFDDDAPPPTTSTSSTSTSSTSTSTTSTTVFQPTTTTAPATTTTVAPTTTTTVAAAILPTTVVQTTTTTAAPIAEVAGVQVARPAALPRTGADPGLLLMLGGTLVVSGILLLRYSTEPI